MSKGRNIQAKHRVTGRIKFHNPTTQVSTSRARHRVTSCISQISPGMLESRNQKRHIWKITIGCHKEKMLRRHLCAKSPIIPMSRHRKTGCSQERMMTRQVCCLRESSFFRSWLRGLKNNSGKLKFTIFPVNSATWCTFARDCRWASFQMTRSVDTCIRICLNYAFANYQDILNILTGTILENKQDGTRHFARRRKIFRRRPDRW